MPIFDSRHTIVLIGCRGVGKTSLVHYLGSEPSVAVWEQPEPTVSIGKTSVDESRFGNRSWILDTPGQSVKNPRFSRDVHKADLIIDVVANGYHARPNQPQVRSDKELRSTVSANRKQELLSAESWAEILAPFGPIKLLTVVTKADLWWDDRADVMSWYETTYFEAWRHVAPRAHTVAFSAKYERYRDFKSIARDFDDRVRHRVVSSFEKTLSLQLARL